MSLCARAVDVADEASSSSAAAADGSDLSAPYLFVRIRSGAASRTLRFSPGAGNLDEIPITSIHADGEDVDSSVSNAASAAGLDYSHVYETSAGKQCDWVATVQETYEPTEVAAGLWVLPNWKTPPDPQTTNIIINPGLAFGVGEHPTTKLCLLHLREVIKGGEHIMDYGTCTGVLGIAALKMGAGCCSIYWDRHRSSMPVYLVPTNLQPSCFPSNISKSEGEGNKLSNHFDLKSSRGTYDIVAANILLNPLLELVEDIVGYAKPGGMVAVSGILGERVPNIEEVYSRYSDNMLVSVMDGWACFQGTRRV